jgi:hypothetical protein
MAETPSLADAWGQILEANLRYYESLGKLATEWLTDVATVGSALRVPMISVAAPTVNVVPRVGGPAASRPQPANTDEPVLLVLEARGGEVATGAFEIENTIGRRVDQDVEASPFSIADGAEVTLAIEFAPASVGLDPGEQVVVAVSVVVPDDLADEARGTVRIAGVSNAQIPVLIRRVAD